MNVFDTMLPIKNKEGYIDIDANLLDTLDTMLTNNGIAHAFALPLEGHPAEMFMYYDSKQDMEVSLTYALFCKLHRGYSNELLAKALVKIAAAHGEESNRVECVDGLAVGDRVAIVDNGGRYTSNEEWFKIYEPQLLGEYTRECGYLDRGTIIAIHPHQHRKTDYCAAIRLDHNGKIALMTCRSDYLAKP